MIPPVIAAIYAGLNALLLVWLTLRVVGHRRAGSVSLGDGGDETMMRSIRGHANAAETMPMALILLAVANLMGAPGLFLHLAGVVLTAGRLMHGLRFNGIGPVWFRVAGMALTLLSIVGLALGLTVWSLLWML